MLRRRTLIQGLLATVATPALAQNSFLTPGGSSVPGIVTMCLSSNVAVPCATSGGSFPPNISGTQATIAADFAGQQYWASAASQASFAAWLTAIGGTYSRASSATYLQGGVVKTAAANVPRFPTDAGGVPQGLRLTGAGTNQVVQSQNFTAANWSVVGTVTLTPASATAPDGTNTATRLQSPVAINQSDDQLTQLALAAASQTHTASVWAKTTSGTQQFSIKLTQSAVLDHFSPDLTATTTWQRFTFSQLFAAGGNGNANVGIAPDSTLSARDMLIWGFQLDTNSSFATDYIPTTTATVTQAADSFSFPFTQTTYSALVGANSQLVGTGSERILGVGNDAPIIIGSTPHFDLFANPLFITGPTVASILASNKMMVAGNATSVAVTANGLVPVSAAGAITSAAPATATLGALTGGGANYSYGNFSQLAIWNGLVASTAEMQRLTT